MIPFNRPNLFGPEADYVRDTFESGKTSGDGTYSRRCQALLEQRLGARKILLTPSCTHALEMAALLCDVGPGDEVILPSFTFVSTANAFVLRGARPVFCEIRPDTLNIDETRIEALVTDRTRVIVPVHYGSVACRMDAILDIARRHGLRVVEDAAQAVNARHGDRYLGTMGDLGCFSFHETKNFSMGEGGALVVNDESLLERAEIVREKGTDRSRFLRGMVDKYTWRDVGSSWLPSEPSAALLWAQLERMDDIQRRRLAITARYREGLRGLEAEGRLRLPIVPDATAWNGHLFYLLASTEDQRDALIAHLKARGVNAVFHYMPLHESSFCRERWGDRSLPVTESISRRLLRLPMFYSLTDDEVDRVVDAVASFYDTP